MKILYLKFGDFKGANFTGSEEASSALDQMDKLEGQERKDKLCEVIDLFNGEIFLWWENRYVGKEQAKAYVQNYKTT